MVISTGAGPNLTLGVTVILGSEVKAQDGRPENAWVWYDAVRVSVQFDCYIGHANGCIRACSESYTA